MIEPALSRFSATLTALLVAPPRACNSTFPNFLRNILDMKTKLRASFLFETYNLLSFGSNLGLLSYWGS